MAKYTNPIVIDAMLDKISTATQLIVTPSQPANRAAAVSAGIATANLSGAFSKIDGPSGGRRLTVGQQSNIVAAKAGTASHVCLVDGSNLLYCTTVTPQAVDAGNTVTIPAWTVTVGGPV